MNRWPDAEQAFRAALRIREHLVRQNPTVTDYRVALAWSVAHLANVLRDSGSADADQFWQQAHDMRERLIRDFPAVADYRADLASSFLDRGIAELAEGHADAAVKSCQQATHMLETLVQKNPTSIVYQSRLGAGLAILGKAQLAAGSLSDAETSCREAVNLRAKLVQENPTMEDYKVDVAASCRDLGDVYRAMKKMDEAAALYRAADEIRDAMATADQAQQPRAPPRLTKRPRHRDKPTAPGGDSSNSRRPPLLRRLCRGERFLPASGRRRQSQGDQSQAGHVRRRIDRVVVALHHFLPGLLSQRNELRRIRIGQIIRRIIEVRRTEHDGALRHQL